jgi:hypothetical protein
MKYERAKSVAAVVDRSVEFVKTVQRELFVGVIIFVFTRASVN